MVSRPQIIGALGTVSKDKWSVVIHCICILMQKVFKIPGVVAYPFSFMQCSCILEGKFRGSREEAGREVAGRELIK